MERSTALLQAKALSIGDRFGFPEKFLLATNLVRAWGVYLVRSQAFCFAIARLNFHQDVSNLSRILSN